MSLDFAATTYRTVRARIREQDPQIDEQTLADTVEGLTDLQEILAAVIRAALADQALATGLEGGIGEMYVSALFLVLPGQNDLRDVPSYANRPNALGRSHDCYCVDAMLAIR